MGNILDYIAWRGDLALEQSPFNDVDALILSWLSYVPFDGIISGRFSESLLLREAASKWLTKPAVERKDSLNKNDLVLLRMLGESHRFGAMRLCGYISRNDKEKQTQFAALTIALGNGSCFVSYRGTDDTLVGWKENVNMSFMMPVPAQLAALQYLEQVADVAAGALLLGGHSKGGNLAAYAASFCSSEIQDRIVRVYSNDGPGFPEEIVTRSGYQAVCSRITTFVPQSSVVGLLLEHGEGYTVVRSEETGIMQHSPFSWDVMRDHFICLEAITKSGRFVDKTLKQWLADRTPQQRERVVDALYSALQQTQATTMTELTAKWFQNAGVVLKSFQNMDEETRQLISQTLSLLFQSARDNMGIFMPTLPFSKKEI